MAEMLLQQKIEIAGLQVGCASAHFINLLQL